MQLSVFSPGKGAENRVSAGSGILVVGPAEEWQRELKSQLATAEVSCIDSGDAALRLCEESPPDLLIIAMVLRDMTGLGLCRKIREDPELRRVPIIISSSHTSEIDRVLAFECGADDFVSIPVSGREMAARTTAVLRRASRRAAGAAPQRRLRFGSLAFDPDRQRVEVDGAVVSLTATEFRVLGLLVDRPGKVVSRENLLEEITATGSPRSERVIDAHIKSIRRKLGAARDYIRTVRSIGYCFSVPAPAEQERDDPEA
jgi:two-component system phosphate regulon response regulator PhoB